MRLSRREMLRYTAVATGAAAVHRRSWGLGREVPATPLSEVRYEQVVVLGALQVAQRENARSILMAIHPDSLVKPFREMAGQPAPGASLGGWYEWKPDFDFHHDDAGFAPAHCYGQWMSALARLAASAKAGGAAGDPAMEARVLQLDEMLAATISPAYFDKTRFPCYSFDKLVCGLMDAHSLLGMAGRSRRWTRCLSRRSRGCRAIPFEREMQWKMGADQSWMWDESYTMSENLFLVSAMGADAKYRAMARAYLDDRALFEPLARNVNALSDQHAYSYTNALCSAMQAYLTDGSLMHLDAARNGFAMIEAQSFVTGGWGPDELLRKPGYDDVANSLTNTHNSFETPCGSYAHMKLTDISCARRVMVITGIVWSAFSSTLCLAHCRCSPMVRRFIMRTIISRGEANLFRASVAVLRGNVAAGGRRLRGERILSGAGFDLGQSLPALGSVLDRG